MLRRRVLEMLCRLRGHNWRPEAAGTVGALFSDGSLVVLPSTREQCRRCGAALYHIETRDLLAHLWEMED